jgi:hypothetical protein
MQVSAKTNDLLSRPPAPVFLKTGAGEFIKIEAMITMCFARKMYCLDMDDEEPNAVKR